MNDDIIDKMTIDQYLKYYTHSFYCDNCQELNVRYIKKGERVDKVGTECSKCGCYIHGGKS
jgi:hypothetical protein